MPDQQVHLWRTDGLNNAADKDSLEINIDSSISLKNTSGFRLHFPGRFRVD
jgi:hypothetical protein